MLLKEHIITLHRFEDLDSFYEDMETPGGNLYIPGRIVEVAHKRPLSRNTHYLLTAEEADLVAQDPRVMGVELGYEEAGVKIRRHWTQTSSFWNKSNTVSQSHKNWALLRCIEGSTRTGWGSDGTTNVSGTVTTTSSGRNVDVVIVDGHFDPAHPEFAVNANGTGGSRVQQFNWLSLDPEVSGNPAGTYVYTPYVDIADVDLTDDNDHGCHVAGTACGNSLGWARDANIYNINPYASNSNNVYLYLIDYIKAWHLSKPINPETGRRNPTITNHSYGLTYTLPISDIASLRYYGNTYTGPFSEGQLATYGVITVAGESYIPYLSPAFAQDLIDLAAAGVIIVGSAGNDSAGIFDFSSVASNPYNNFIRETDNTVWYYNRGTITAAQGVICVGAVDALSTEQKAQFSNCGPRVDIYAPGRLIMSSINSTTGVTASDSRNSSYKITKKSGTSMSSPQVAGVLACLAEQWPTMRQNQALEYITQHATSSQITDSGGGSTDYTSLQGSDNKYLFYYKDRLETGQVGPKINLGARPSKGMTWPRPKIYRYGR
jgi:hypothetical protein